MDNQYEIVIIGGGVLGGACAISLARRLGPGRVALIERKVLGAGLSSRHSAIVRAVNASSTATRMATQAIACWKRLDAHWGTRITYQVPGALWIAPSHSKKQWSTLAHTMKEEGVNFHSLSPSEAKKLCQNAISTAPQEIYYYEPDALLLDTSNVLTALKAALKAADVVIHEHCRVNDMEQDKDGRIVKIHTPQKVIGCSQVVNAAGAWSAGLFSRCGIAIPVALDPVLAVNFLISDREIPNGLPIIADHRHGFYFRRWPGCQLHVHRPRSRKKQDILAAFTRLSFTPVGADSIYEAGNLVTNHTRQIETYQQTVQDRFPEGGKPVTLSAQPSFFDITPDLRFILGRDEMAGNLYHCLGAGQALKYAPVFGEIIAALMTDVDPGFDLREFSITRFRNHPFCTASLDQHHTFF